MAGSTPELLGEAAPKDTVQVGGSDKSAEAIADFTQQPRPKGAIRLIPQI